MLEGSVRPTLFCMALAGTAFSPSASGDGPEMKASSRDSAQTQDADRTAKKTLMNGRWGGQGISMEVADKGAVLTFDCAQGAIGEPIVLDRSGRFLVAGSVVMERPGPSRRDDAAAGRPATYAGLVDGQSLTLTIKWTGTEETMGVFTLAFGKAGRIRRCS